MEIIEQLNGSLANRYRIERAIGSGGMATVYAAKDVKHGRHVAVKVLEPEIAAVLGDRFLAEIRVTAALQHPNLVPLFDSGDANGMLYYVMPLIEGESLRTRLDRERQLSVDEAVRLASAVASALEYAHSRGVIHRDLKPENILLHAGEPLVADFGIALAVSRAGGARITQTGISLGTPQYMSPEQATGERGIDARTDIYSLAAVLYEMLTGQPPHTGATVQAVIGRVVTERPQSVRAARPAVPMHVAFAIEKALEKVPADRWSSAREFGDAINGRLSVASTSTLIPAANGKLRALALGVLSLASVAMAVAGWWRVINPREPVMAFALGLPLGVLIDDGAYAPIAVSADGRTIAFVGASGSTKQLYVKRLDETQARLLPGTEGATAPTFSPDGASLGFIVNGHLRRMSTSGGASIEIQDGAVATSGSWPPVTPSWTAPDRIIVTPSGIPGLARVIHAVPAIGGAPVAMTRLDSASQEAEQRWPLALPDGETVLYTSLPRGNNLALARIGVASLTTGRAIPLHVPGARALGLIDNHLIFLTKEGQIRAVRADIRRARITGSPVTLIEGVKVAYGANAVALSSNGTLVYLRGNGREQRLVLVDRTGAKLPVGPLHDYDVVRASPEGRRIAVDIDSDSSRDVWLYDVDQGTLTPLKAKANRTGPAWSADGRWLYFRNEERPDTLFRRPADGTGSESAVAVQPMDGFALSSGGALILWGGDGPRGPGRPRFRQLDVDTVFRPLPGGTDADFGYRFSPDGRWLAMVSAESGVSQVYVRPFPAAGPRVQVSTKRGAEPVWSPDGKEVFFRDWEHFFAAELDFSRAPVVKQRRELFRDEFEAWGDPPAYDVMRDGRFVVINHGDERDQVIVIVNWRDQVRARLRQSR